MKYDAARPKRHDDLDEDEALEEGLEEMGDDEYDADDEYDTDFDELDDGFDDEDETGFP